MNMQIINTDALFNSFFSCWCKEARVVGGLTELINDRSDDHVSQGSC